MSKEAATNITRNAPSNENRWASKCFISSFKSPANHNNFSFPFSPLLLITLLMPNSTSLSVRFSFFQKSLQTLSTTPPLLLPQAITFKLSSFSSNLPRSPHNACTSPKSSKPFPRIFPLARVVLSLPF